MKIWTLLPALFHTLVLGLLAVPVRAAEPEVPAPFQIVRSLQALQTQIAEGSQEAMSAQPKLIAQIALQFARTPENLWQDSRNVKAAAVFLFSGGGATSVRPLLANKKIAEADRLLITAALAYVEGREKEAAKLFSQISARELPPDVGGHLALAQAALLSRTDTVGASNLLDIARLLMPGTLVEEAALRRQIFLMEPNADFDKFVLVSRQYFQRYRKSVYAANCWKGFSRTLVNYTLLADAEGLKKIENFVADFQPSEQRLLFLDVARHALVNGKAATALQMARDAGKLSPEGSMEAARATVYEGSALIVDNSILNGLEKLQATKRTGLGAEDAELAATASMLGNNLQASTIEVNAGDAPARDFSVGSKTLEIGKNSLEQARLLLTRGARP